MPDTPSHTFPSVEELAALLPPYEIQCCIHEGLTSAIYLARQTALARMVMIRIMPEPEPEFAPMLLERLRKRARLVDPRIVSVFDFGRTVAGPLYLVTEHVDGDLLDALILDKQVTPKHAFQLASQLCEALQMIHDLHIVHGALSCRTILVTRDWHLKVTGIGMSETAEGELSWMEESAATYADDIYALGSVIHAMFSGKLPTDTGQVSSSLPTAFAGAIERCLTGDLTRRYQHPREVRAALTEALRAEKRAAAAPVPAIGAAAVPAKTGAPAVAQAPPKVLPGRPPPRMAPPPPPSFLARLDAFFWSAMRTSLHLLIIGVTVIALGALILFKDRIVFEDPDDSDSSASSSASKPAEKAPPPANSLTPKDARYRNALQREVAAAREAKRVDDLPHLRRELQRVQSGRGVPSEDDADLPAVLKRLRKDYRKLPGDS